MSGDAMQDTYRKVAGDVADDVLRLFREPPLDPTPVSIDAYRHLDLGWYRTATTALEGQGFRLVRDLDGSNVVAPGSPAPLVRVFLGPDGSESAALFQLLPRSPGFFQKMLLRLLGKWPKSARVVEVVSYVDARAFSTMNAGDANHFEPPPWAARVSLPLETPVAEVVATHRTRLAAESQPLRRFSGFDDLNATRNEHLSRSHAWRAEVGLLPVELDRMLAPHGAFGEALRPYLLDEVSRRMREAPGVRP